MSVQLYRRPPGKNWHYAFTVAGRRFRGSTGTENKKWARQVAAKAEAEVWSGAVDEPGQTLTFAQAAIAYREAGNSARFLERVEDYWRDTLVRKITPGLIRRAARQMYPTHSGATRNRQVVTPTCAIINYAAELGWCASIRPKRFPVDPKKKIPAELAWVRAYADQALKDGLPHHAALALFMFGTGARVGQATALTWADVDLQRAVATIRTLKPRPWTREAHLPDEVIAALANIPSNRNPADRVFKLAGSDSVQQIWHRIRQRAALPHLTTHCLRHGGATAMARHGYDLATTAARLGWRDKATLARTYLHELPDPTVTDALFDTELTHEAARSDLSASKVRRNSI